MHVQISHVSFEFVVHTCMVYLKWFSISDVTFYITVYSIDFLVLINFEGIYFHILFILHGVVKFIYKTNSLILGHNIKISLCHIVARLYFTLIYYWNGLRNIESYVKYQTKLDEQQVLIITLYHCCNNMWYYSFDHLHSYACILTMFIFKIVSF